MSTFPGRGLVSLRFSVSGSSSRPYSNSWIEGRMPVDKNTEQMMNELFRIAGEDLVSTGDAPETWIELSGSQVDLLESNGNLCEDWSKVRILDNAILESVRNCVFSGDIRMSLHPCECKKQGTVNPLLFNSRFDNVRILRGCRIISTGILRNLRLGEGTVIENCGRLVFSKGATCGCGTELELGVETGERNVRSFSHLDMDLAYLLSGGGERNKALSIYNSLLDEFLAKLRSASLGFIGKGCRILNTPVVENSYLGAGAVVSNACAVRNSTLLGGDNAPVSVTDGALVRDSILKWGSKADSMAIVDRSILGEASIVEKHGKLSTSFLGHDSVLAEGEITASLAGPFTAAHHQSLLIAARWPEGRGNIGYGANIGSNHTSRLPDQEVRPGEGMFFGLACSVKFPADFSLAPYSIIATGVTTLPQRVEFPFSLICEPFRSVDGVPPAYNQIIPAWVLSDNLFAVNRNEAKYSSRNRSSHSKPGGSIIREDTIRMMADSMRKLQVEELQAIYTGKEISGLGKNFITDEHRLKAIDTYRFHIQYFALEGLSEAGDPERLSPFQRSILEKEFQDNRKNELLSLLPGMREDINARIRTSREKDFSRGIRIVSDYSDVRKL
jgi:hypothetical protein